VSLDADPPAIFCTRRVSNSFFSSTSCLDKSFFDLETSLSLQSRHEALPHVLGLKFIGLDFCHFDVYKEFKILGPCFHSDFLPQKVLQPPSCSNNVNGFYSPRRTSCLTLTKFGIPHLPPEPYFVNCKAVPTPRETMHLILSIRFPCCYLICRQLLWLLGAACSDLALTSTRAMSSRSLEGRSPTNLLTL